jgi:streptogramin lyase
MRRFPSNLLILASFVNAAACSGTREPGDWTLENVGKATAAITLAPGSAKCVVFKVSGTTTVARQFDVAPDTSTFFDLAGLPLGMDVFNASAYGSVCSQIGTTPATWISSPITANVSASAPVSLNFVMVPNVDAGSAGVSLTFPTPNHGVVTEFSLPSATSKPDGIAAGPDGNLWLSEANEIARMTTAGVITQFALTSASGVAVSPGPDGNIWFTGPGDSITRVTPGGSIAYFPIPTTNADLQDITAGPDGNMWFVEFTGNKIGRITLGGVVTEFTVPTPNSSPAGIVAGPDGNLWFAEYFGGKVGRMTPSGVFTEYVVNGDPIGVAAGPEGNVWFTNGAGAAVGFITPAGVVTEYTGNIYPAEICAGPDGALWFTDTFGNQIGRITTAGAMTLYPVPTPGGGPSGITVGPDGNVWFTEHGAGKVAFITP